MCQSSPSEAAKHASASDEVSTCTGGSSWGSRSVSPRRTDSAPKEHCGPSLNVCPGDVFQVYSADKNSISVGAVGGAMGHVMVALSWPRIIHRASPEGDDLRDVVPAASWPIWAVNTMESSRQDAGLHLAEVFLHFGSRGELVLIGELTQEGEWVNFSGNFSTVWAAPEELREDFNEQLANEVVQDMKTQEDDWSLITAVKAFLWSPEVDDREDPRQILRDLQFSWTQKPICTSIVIAFWQRYLLKLSALDNHCFMDPVFLIMKWMPLKADLALPYELITTMTRCGWSRVYHEPVTDPLTITWL